MPIIKSLRKTIATLAVFAGFAVTAHAAPVTIAASYNVANNQTFTITTGNTGSSVWDGIVNANIDNSGRYYEFITGNSAKSLILSLLSTSPSKMNVTYSLFRDINLNTGAGSGKGNTSTPVGTPVTLTDVTTGQDPKAFFTLAANSQYLLYIDPQNATLANLWNGASPVVTQVSAVPLPAAFWMFGSAILGFFGFANRRKV